MPTNSDTGIMLSPSIIASDLSTMGRDVSAFDPSAFDLLHIDVMDGNFVPNLTFGPGYIRALGSHTTIPLDIHLMIERPELSLEAYLELVPWCLTIHYESTRFPSRILQTIRKAGVRAGLSVNPATPIEALYDLSGECDLILVMSVDPGFYGQAFMPAALDRIRRLRGHLDSTAGGAGTLIQVDGGISVKNIGEVARAGARVIVAGNAVFGADDPNRAARELKRAAADGMRAV